MEQDQGYNQQNKPQKEGLGQQWKNARPTKAMLFWSCLACMVLTMLIGFQWGGWVTGGMSQKIAQEMADDAVVKRLAPMCVIQFNQDPGKVQKYAELKAANMWQRSEYIEKQGWATMSGEAKPDRKVASECATLIMQISQNTLAPSPEKLSSLQ